MGAAQSKISVEWVNMRQARFGAALGLNQVTVLSRWKPSSCIA